MSPEITPSVSITEKYRKFFDEKFTPHAVLAKQPIMIEVLSCNADQCRELGVWEGSTLCSARSLWKVVLGLNEQQNICFVHMLLDEMDDIMEAQKRDGERWPDTKRRVATEFLIRTGELTGIRTT